MGAVTHSSWRSVVVASADWDVGLCWMWTPWRLSYLALMRYWATLILAGEPVIVTWRTAEPSVALAILMWAPDTWRISLILLPCLPIMQPINYGEGGGVCVKTKLGHVSMLFIIKCQNIKISRKLYFYERHHDNMVKEYKIRQQKCFYYRKYCLILIL